MAVDERNFFCPTIPAEGECVSLSDEEAGHAVRVLRAQPGDRLVLLDGVGTRADGLVTDVGTYGRRSSLTCCVEKRECIVPSRRRIRLVVAPPRSKQMSLIVRQATELGVWRISPVICEYAVARPKAGSIHQWRREAVAAMKQSGNDFLPQFEAAADFGDLIATRSGGGLYGDSGDDEEFVDGVEESLKGADEMAVWIGPEGGFAEEEKAALQNSGFVPVKVGRWTLRVETAVPALLGWLSGKGLLI
ncbi:MAG: 16S rRNA (uracil(1498)-N(3))-methyltransferase [Candidatus Pacebacteria bacterium]|nr:16S rRNA (uracil(1498)-N(3))-methyltransferase [Candidatus Paceibacterota bacterium]